MLDRPYEAQLASKRALVAAAFEAHRETADAPIDDVVPSPRIVGYRNRLLYPVATAGRKVIGGFFRRGSHDLIDVKMCAIQDPAITSVASTLVSEIERLRLPILPLPGTESVAGDEVRSADWSEGAATPAHEKSSHSGSAAIRALAVRLAPGSGELMVALVTTSGLLPAAEDLARAAERASADALTASRRRARLASVMRNIQDGETNVVLGRRSLPIKGRDYLLDRFFGFQWRVSLPSFTQPNMEAARAAVQHLLREVSDSAAGVVVDAYAGIGMLALALSRSAARVVAIEQAASAVRDGRENVKMNRLRNVDFVEGDAASAIPEAAARGPVSLLVLDPPRRGLSEAALEASLRAAPLRIAYLACSPQSHARDLAAVIRGGYRLERTTPFDFFPHTGHVEVLSVLRRR
ncbi:MAG: class I SAM-dependent RNA methyltransferase [Planctomycetes bacterium]|nr:class I SAM-dependent RNA methyltransferase [Planctomycetota bacterium]